MARKTQTKIEKLRRPSRELLRKRFEERLMSSLGKDSREHPWIVAKKPDGTYQNPDIEQRWSGFLLAYDMGPGAVQMQEATPFISDMLRDMRALADNVRNGTALGGDLAQILDKWAGELETRAESIFEDVYEQLVDMRETNLRDYSRARKPFPFPASVVDTASMLWDYFNATQAARNISPRASSTQELEASGPTSATCVALPE
jgi:hypothetical protein